MGKAKGKHRLDKFYWLAKEQGYRSRAAFKLIQLDAKYSFLYKAHAVLDLCAAPGSWMQVVVKRVPVGSLVLGVDLNQIPPMQGAISFQADITTTECKAAIKKQLAENGRKAFDLILHDGSPNVGGAWAQEATSQNALVVESIKIATQFLCPKGTLVTKIFRSQDYTAVLYCLRQLFENVEVTKPGASRSTSAEIYAVGFRYKAPAKIDPRLLDVKHLFQGAIEPPKVIDVLRGTKQKRHRDGYEDGTSIVRKVTSAADFVWSDTPLDILGTVTSIDFQDPASCSIKDHALTTEEVKSLCEDLGVLGKQDFKHLLKWRMNIRKALAPIKEDSQRAMDTGNENADDDEEKEKDEDEKVLKEMEELTHIMERKKKHQKKLLNKRREKEKARKALGIQKDVMEDDYVDHDLFSLASIKRKKDLATVDANEDVDEEVELVKSSDEEENKVDEDPEASDLDSDEEHQRYEDALEEFFDEAYEQYISKREGSTKQRKRAKQSSKPDELVEVNADEDMCDADDDASEKNEDDLETNPLLDPIVKDRDPTTEEIARQWFTQGIFFEAREQGDLGDLGKGDSDDEVEEGEEEDKVPIAKKTKEDARKRSKDVDSAKVKASKTEDDFEIVPAPASDSSDDSSSDSEEYDNDTKAEILAYAKKMLRKKHREQIIDDAYNKYMFDDDGLPKWFLEEEKRHRQPLKPVTKEEIAAMKAQFREINARPVKKVAEAKARKRKAATRKLEKVRKKANSIADQNEIPDRSKRRLIEQLYKKAAPKKPKKEYVVAKKGVSVKVGKGKVLVDRRMKKDVRKHGMRKKGKDGKNVEGKRRKGAAKASSKKGKK